VSFRETRCRSARALTGFARATREIPCVRPAAAKVRSFEAARGQHDLLKEDTMKTRLAALAALLALSVGCGATVHSSIAPNANLGQYRTFAFKMPRYHAGQPETPAEQELRSTLRNDLALKGLTEAAPGQQPDFLISYHVKQQQKIDVDTVGYGFGWWGGPADVYTYTEGTLIVDFIDPRTNQAFWRGTASDVVNHPYSPDLAKVDKAVAKLVNQYPAQMAAMPRPTM
jgi:Domain of unknown function (DUF4136)